MAMDTHHRYIALLVFELKRTERSLYVCITGTWVPHHIRNATPHSLVVRTLATVGGPNAE